MSQQEILDFLRKHKNEWFTVKQIASYLNIPEARVNSNIKRLRKSIYICYKLNKNLYNNLRAYIYSYRE